MLSAPDWGFPRLRCAEWGNRMLASSDCTAIIVPTHQRSEDWGTANRSFHHAQRDTVSRFKISWTFCQCLIFPWLSMTSGNFQVSCRDTQTVHTSDPRRLCSSFCLKGLLCAYMCVCMHTMFTPSQYSMHADKHMCRHLTGSLHDVIDDADWRCCRHLKEQQQQYCTHTRLLGRSSLHTHELNFCSFECLYIQ